MDAVQFQVMSDLHLETPQARPTYAEFEIEPRCHTLALLGDIGYVQDDRLFDFLKRQLRAFQTVFYVLGNHEPYGTTVETARSALRNFEATNKQRRLQQDSGEGEFVFLDRRRYDSSPYLTVLGCTLFSRITAAQYQSVSRFVTDFHAISNWTAEDHCDAYLADLEWLNAQVKSIQENEPDRTIVIFTHHSPTLLAAANNPKHLEDDMQVRSAFVTDLSDQTCWRSPRVKLWAFGHTHWNCDFQDPMTGKRVLANQKGYRRSEADTFDSAKVVNVDAKPQAAIAATGLEAKDPEAGAEQE